MHFRLLGLQNSKSIDSVRIATQNLSKEEAKAIIIKSNLNDKEKERLLIELGYVKAQAKKLVTQKTSIVANEQEIASISRLTMVKQKLQGVVTGLGGAFKGFFKSLIKNPFFLITTAVTLLTQLFDAINVTTEEYNEKLTKLSQEYTEIKSEISSLNSELKTTKDRITELETKGKLTLVEENELSNLQRINAELERKIALEEREQKNKGLELSQGFVDAVKSQIDEKTVIHNPITGNPEQINQTDEFVLSAYQYKTFKNVPTDRIKDFDKYEELLRRYEENMQSIISKFEKQKDLIKDVDYKYLSGEAKKYYDYITTLEDIMLAYSGDESAFDGVYYSERFTEARVALQKLGDEGELTSEKISKLYKSNDSVKKLIEYLRELGLISVDLSKFPQDGIFGHVIKSLPEGIDGFEALANQLNKVEESTDNAIHNLKSLEVITEEVDQLQESYKGLNSVIKSYNESGFLSIDNIQTLLSLDADTISTLQVENGQLKLNAKAYKALINAKITELEISQAKNILDGVLAMSVEEAQAYANSEAYLEEASSIETLLQNQVQLALITARQKDAENNTTAYSDAVKASISQIVNLTSVYEQTRVALNENMDSVMDDTDAIKANEKALKAQKKALESQKDALEQQKDIQEKNKETLEDNKSALEDLIDLTEEYIKQIKEDEKSALEERKEAMQEQIDAEIELLDKEKERADFEKSLAEKQNNLSKANLSLISASLDDSSVGKKNYKEAQDEYNDANSEMTEFLSEHNYDIQKEALENFKTSQEEYYDDLIDTVDEYLDDEVQLYKDACEMIDNDNGTLYNNLLGYVQTYTTTTNSEFNHMWSEAQSALQDYNDLHYSTFELMDYLQGCIYTTEAVIESYETKIENVANAINTVQSQIDDTATSINNNATAINNFNDAYKKMAEAFKGYKLKYNVNGKEQEFVSIFSDKRLAAQDIAGQISRNSKNTIEVPWYAIYGNLHKYARGTKSAVGGLSVVDEEGLGSELIPKSLGGGRYTVLPYGNPVFSKAMTNELFDFSNDPTSYLANIMPQFREQMLNNIGGIPEVKQTNVANAPNISINIQGNADASTVRALRQEADNIVKKATEASMRNIINIVDRNNFVNK